MAEPGWVLGGDQTRTQSVFDGVLQLLHEKSPSQLGHDLNFDGGAVGGEEGFEDEDNDHDNILMDNVADLVGAFAKTCGVAIAQVSGHTEVNI